MSIYSLPFWAMLMLWPLVMLGIAIIALAVLAFTGTSLVDLFHSLGDRGAKLTCWHCQQETSAIRKTCQHCGKELQ